MWDSRDGTFSNSGPTLREETLMILPGTRLRRFVALAAVLYGAAAQAQVSGGQITGTVRGPRGDAVRGATVTVTNQATRASRATSRAADGSYALAGLSTAAYTVVASLPGQQRASQR